MEIRDFIAIVALIASFLSLYFNRKTEKRVIKNEIEDKKNKQIEIVDDFKEELQQLYIKLSQVCKEENKISKYDKEDIIAFFDKEKYAKENLKSIVSQNSIENFTKLKREVDEAIDKVVYTVSSEKESFKNLQIKIENIKIFKKNLKINYLNL